MNEQTLAYVVVIGALVVFAIAVAYAILSFAGGIDLPALVSVR